MKLRIVIDYCEAEGSCDRPPDLVLNAFDFARDNGVFGDSTVQVLELTVVGEEACDCPDGWVWPMASDGDSTFPFVERCDDCKVFADDIEAAKALAATLEGGRMKMEPVHGDPARLQPAVYPCEGWTTIPQACA